MSIKIISKDNFNNHNNKKNKCSEICKKKNRHKLCSLYILDKPENMIHRRPIFALLTVSNILGNNQEATTQLQL